MAQHASLEGADMLAAMLSPRGIKHRGARVLGTTPVRDDEGSGVSWLESEVYHKHELQAYHRDENTDFRVTGCIAA